MPVRRVRVAWLHTGAWCCARPTGDKHGRTTRGPAHRRGGAKRRPRRERVKQVRVRRGPGQYKGLSPVPWEVWELRPGWSKCPVGTEGGKPRPDYGLPNLTPWRLSVVTIRCSAFTAC